MLNQKKMQKKKIQESLEDYVKKSDPLMHVFLAKTIQGTAYLPGSEDNKNDGKNEDNKDNNN